MSPDGERNAPPSAVGSATKIVVVAALVEGVEEGVPGVVLADFVGVDVVVVVDRALLLSEADGAVEPQAAATRAAASTATATCALRGCTYPE
jgi:hypothetical protein